MDQQTALRRVRAGIGHFGGAAGNVTVAGQSAGGSSACSRPTRDFAQEHDLDFWQSLGS